LRPVTQSELLAGKYRLLATLGHGGMADVYLGAAQGPAGFNKLVVIKKLRNANEDPALVQMFFDEARLAARLNHPNIVHTYEVEESPDGYMLVMEYLEGQSLRRFAKAYRAHGGTFEPALAASLIAEALAGLHYVHEMRDYDGTPLDVVHRDVSPQNLFITYDGQVKVLDFGIAKGSLNVTDTQSGVLKGKVSYMAPEQATEEGVDRRADIFSAGVVLWELLTGEKLFKGDTVAALRSLTNAPIDPPSEHAPGIPPELDAIVMKALARSPNGRFGTALAMSNSLSDWLMREGYVIRRDEIAQHMQQLFAGAREAMAKRVQAYMLSRTSDVPRQSDPFGPLSGVRPAVKKKSAFLPFVAASFAIGLVAAAGVVFMRSKNVVKDVASGAVSELAAAKGGDTEQTFHLTLSSDPPEATVEWGGNVVGQTPMLIDLSPGPQTFLLSRDGYFKATVVLNITDAMTGRNESRTVVLVPRPKGRGAPMLPAKPGTVPKSVVAQNAPLAAAAQPANTPPDAIGGTVAAPASAALPPPPAALPASPAPIAAKQAPPPAVEAPSPPAPAAAPASPAVLPFGPEMTRPTLLSGSDLVTPREALVAGVSGTVIAKCTITAEGTLRNCRIIKGLPYLDKPMLDMLATRRYSPVVYQGKPVSVEYVFNLKVAPPAR
jgi:tRNA A-37 threonylcarbamoyl transferase component Bud32